MREARAAGALQAAPGEYRLASEKRELGEHYIASRDYKPARWLVEQARVDVELARMKAMSARARAEAARRTAALRDELRTTEGASR